MDCSLLGSSVHGIFQARVLEWVAIPSHASIVMLKILKMLKPGFNSMWTKNVQMFKLDLEKAEESEIK